METIAEQFLSSANFQQAWLQVSKKKGCAGSDGETIAQFKQNLNSNLAYLRNARQFWYSGILIFLHP